MRKDVRIVLASASPRRREILSQLGWKFQVVPADVVETRRDGEDPASLVKRLSKLKGADVFKRCPDAMVVASDTVVCCDGKIYGKPKDDDEALSMLQSLVGRNHEVFSGLALFWGGRVLCDCDCTEVTFRHADDETLRAYVATGEPRGKAGAYAIQGCGRLLVKSIWGDYSTVVGLPVALLADMMGELGFAPFDLTEVSTFE